MPTNGSIPCLALRVALFAGMVLVSLPSQGAGTDGRDPLRPPNPIAGSRILYEVQVRTANACHPDVGSPAQKLACARKPAPRVQYRAEKEQCGIIDELHRIKLGTLNDLMEETADFRSGITLRYISEKVGANTVWLMPLFPNNDTWDLPDPCDNLGSPYAVRDYLHVSGMLSRSCIAEGRDEHSDLPCWANSDLDELIKKAKSKGLKVILDLAFNHFGHNYHLYDYARYRRLPELMQKGGGALEDFERTYDESLVKPELLDSEARLRALAQSDPEIKSRLQPLLSKCPALRGDALVRAYHLWNIAFDDERPSLSCQALALEQELPSFYMAQNAWDPAGSVNQILRQDWKDVKFLFHNSKHPKQREYYRVREYLFRVMNYWVSRGVDGFRLDHTTDPQSHLSAEEWRYILAKVEYYAKKRGQERPFTLAEEFHEQQAMARVSDALTEGYVHDILLRDSGGYGRNASHLDWVLRNMSRFGGSTYVMTALETHDERRLLDQTGLNVWSGAALWGVGASTGSMPMMLMGQELGESWGLGFRRSDYIRARFEGSGHDMPSAQADALLAFYRSMAQARLDSRNPALLSSNGSVIPTRFRPGNGPNPDIFAMAKWEGTNAILAFTLLKSQGAASEDYYLSPEQAAQLSIRDDLSYRLVDLLSGKPWEQSPGALCRSGRDLKNELKVSLDEGTRVMWLRLELCASR